MARQCKYEYWKIIQFNWRCSEGWEDCSYHQCDSTGYMPRDKRKALIEELRQYRISSDGDYRIIFRRELPDNI